MGRHSPEPKPPRARVYWWLGAFAVPLPIGVGLTWRAQVPTSSLASSHPTVAAPHRTEPVVRRETRPTLDPARFVGKARLAHQVAREGGGIVPVVQRAVAVYTPFSLGVPDWKVVPLAPEAVVAFLQATVVLGVFVLSLAAGRRLALSAYPDATTAGHALIPMVALSLLFTVAAIVLLSLPMGMRHDM